MPAAGAVHRTAIRTCGCCAATQMRIRNPSFVIPAKAGIQVFKAFWTPAFAGVTDLY
jgi:hypothetical protein